MAAVSAGSSGSHGSQPVARGNSRSAARRGADGILLVSKNYVEPFEAAPGIMKQAGKAAIPRTWKAHREKLRAMMAIGKVPDRGTDHRDYAKLAKQEWAAW